VTLQFTYLQTDQRQTKEKTMSLTMTNDAQFDAEVLNSSIPVLVDFTADWCPPCKMVAPVLEEIAGQEPERMKVVSLDVDENPVITARYGVMSMPTLALFVGGELVTQMVGARPRTMIMRTLEPHLQSAATAGA
jgi:thioredoxin 1